MLNVKEATRIAKNSIPNGKIQKVIEYGDFYLFLIFNNLVFEEEMDPYYSVNKKTGEFRDFSILTDGNTSEIVKLFIEAKQLK